MPFGAVDDMMRTFLAIGLLTFGTMAFGAPTVAADEYDRCSFIAGASTVIVQRCESGYSCGLRYCGEWESTNTGVYVGGDFVVGTSQYCGGQSWDYENHYCTTSPSVAGETLPVGLAQGGGNYCVFAGDLCIGTSDP